LSWREGASLASDNAQSREGKPTMAKRTEKQRGKIRGGQRRNESLLTKKATSKPRMAELKTRAALSGL